MGLSKGQILTLAVVVIATIGIIAIVMMMKSKSTKYFEISQKNQEIRRLSALGKTSKQISDELQSSGFDVTEDQITQIVNESRVSLPTLADSTTITSTTLTTIAPIVQVPVVTLAAILDSSTAAAFDPTTKVPVATTFTTSFSSPSPSTPFTTSSGDIDVVRLLTTPTPDITKPSDKLFDLITSTQVPTALPTTTDPTTMAPTTAEPTTMAPTTAAPTTMALTTAAPTTMAPTTAAPTTMAPTTAAPTTMAPTTAAPTTMAPTTAAPTTMAPTTAAPTTMAPTTAVPTSPPPTLGSITATITRMQYSNMPMLSITRPTYGIYPTKYDIVISKDGKILVEMSQPANRNNITENPLPPLPPLLGDDYSYTIKITGKAQSKPSSEYDLSSPPYYISWKGN